jgi:putative membrane protein
VSAEPDTGTAAAQPPAPAEASGAPDAASHAAPDAASDDTPDDTPVAAEVEWLRLSPRALAVRPVTDLLRSAPVLVGLLYEGLRGGHNNYWGAALGAFAVLAGIWRWFGTKYRVTEDRVFIKRGLLSPKVLSTPRASVRSVDLTAHVIYRLLGLAQVKIGTGRNDRREGEKLKLDALRVTDAQALRTLLLTSPQAAAAAVGASSKSDPSAVPAPAAPPVETEIVRLSLSWVRFAPLTLTGLVILGVLIGFLTQAGHDAGVNVTAISPVHSGINDVSRVPLSESIPLGALVILLLLLVVSVFGYITIFWNFRLVRNGRGSLVVTRGLLSTRATTIDEARLRGVEISEPLSLRAAKGARLIAITTGLRVGGGSERGGSVLLPPAPQEVADQVVAEILGVPTDVFRVQLLAHGPAARRRRQVRAIVPLLVLCLAVLGILLLAGVRDPYWVTVFLPIGFVLGWLLSRDRYRGLGHRLVDDWIVLSFGSLVRRRSILSVHGVIGWRLRQTWFQRRLGLVTVTATTAAGKQRYSVTDVPMDEALAFIRAATPDLTTPFLTLS